MTSPTVTKQGIEFPLFAKAISELEGIEGRILDRAVAIMLARTRKRFLDQVDPDNKPWVKSKRGLIREGGGKTYRNGKAYTGSGTGFETGALFNNIEAFPQTDQFERRIGVDRSKVPYALDFALGVGSSSPRPYLGINAEDKNLINKALEGLIS